MISAGARSTSIFLYHIHAIAILLQPLMMIVLLSFLLHALTLGHAIATGGYFERVLLRHKSGPSVVSIILYLIVKHLLVIVSGLSVLYFLFSLFLLGVLDLLEDFFAVLRDYRLFCLIASMATLFNLLLHFGEDSRLSVPLHFLLGLLSLNLTLRILLVERFFRIKLAEPLLNLWLNDIALEPFMATLLSLLELRELRLVLLFAFLVLLGLFLHHNH